MLRSPLLPSIRYALLILGAVGYAACAHDVQVQLSPPVSIPVVASVGAGKSVTLLRPRDMRPNQAELGEFGHKACFSNAPCQAIARPESDVAVWVGNAFLPGLLQAGFHVKRAETLGESPTPIAVLITVTQAYVRADETRIAVTVECYRVGQPKALFRRTYAGVSAVGGSGSAEGYQSAMQETLQKLIDQAVPNLANALAGEMG